MKGKILLLPVVRISSVVALCLLLHLGCGSNRVKTYEQSEQAGTVELIPVSPPTSAGRDVDVSPPGLPVSPGNKGLDILDDFDDLLEKNEGEDDVDTLDIKFIYADEGGELEVGENEIDIPEYALPQDTLMALYIPDSPFLEFSVYPAALTFNDSVSVTFSYASAQLDSVDETDISIVQWLPQFQEWEYIGGEVDTLHNVISLKILEFAPPVEDTLYGRYALADHN